jgi:DNA-directed RNA polymerase subunit H (RpoH/RPB5)
MKEIVGSFSAESLDTQLSLFGPPTERERERERERDDGLWPSRKGIPIGNLTSQLFANIYMNELDQFMKHKLKVKYYIRYADDFVIVSDSEDYLKNLLPKIQSFLGEKLKLNLHPNKISIRKAKQGIDFLGYILLPHHRIVRTKTKRRILKKLKMRAREYGDGIISQDTLNQSLQSYLGVMSHANSYGLKKKILEIMN